MSFGAYLASIEPELAKNPGYAIASLFGPGRSVVLVLIILAVVQGNVMNLYSTYMSVVTIYSGFHVISMVNRVQKFVVMAVLILAATFVSMLVQENFDAYFSNMLNAMLYLLVPWSAINLADYYIIRKGEYNVHDMFKVAGEYGAYRWKTIGTYAVAVAVQGPFMSLSFYKGPIAQWIGADMAWVPGLLVAGLLHVIIEKADEIPATKAVS
jgi:NCS1 family nucleobase:cation symporter-1